MQADATGTSEKHPAGKSVAKNLSAKASIPTVDVKRGREIVPRGNAPWRRSAGESQIEVTTS
jgi:hypothetical protein